MIYLLAIVPWVLTVIALVAIIVFSKKPTIKEEFSDEPFWDDDMIPPPMDDDHETIRVAIYDDRAYWVYGNVFYESEVMREPDWATAKPVDTMSMSGKQLDHLLKVLDDLREDEEKE